MGNPVVWPFDRYTPAWTHQRQPIPPRRPCRAAVDRPISNRKERQAAHRINNQVINNFSVSTERPAYVSKKCRSN